MDHKLARGFTREGFRKDINAAEDVADRRLIINLPCFEKLTVGGKKLSRDLIITTLDRLDRFDREDHHTLFSKRFVKPGIKRLSTEYDAGTVGGYLSPLPMTFFGFDEKQRAYSLFYDRYSRKQIELRRSNLPIFIREHAIQRYLERTGRAYSDVTGELWPNIAFLEALMSLSETFVAVPFMIPVPHGAFLGVTAVGEPPDYVEGIDRQIVTSAGPKKDMDRSRLQKLVPMSFVNTFVSMNELEPSQLELRDTLLQMIERHRPMLMFAHVARIMLFKNEPETLGLEEAFSGDLDVTKAAFTHLFQSGIWKKGVRYPSVSPFAKHFVAQGLLEKSEAWHLQ